MEDILIEKMEEIERLTVENQRLEIEKRLRGKCAGCRTCVQQLICVIRKDYGDLRNIAYLSIIEFLVN